MKDHEYGYWNLPYPEAKPISSAEIELDLAKGLWRLALVRHSVEPFCESPIEADFATQAILALRSWNKNIVLCAQSDATVVANLTCFDALLIPQFRWNNFRLDFAIFSPSLTPIAFIECDGKDFHSSREQIANDRRKDNAARAAGIVLKRYSGSDLAKFNSWIATEVYSLIHVSP